MSERCSYCNGGRLVGWSGAGPILCPSCSDGKDAFTVVTQAWREQRARALAAEAERDEGRRILCDAIGCEYTETPVNTLAQVAADFLARVRTDYDEARAEVARLEGELRRRETT